jgi:hypothetical protein
MNIKSLNVRIYNFRGLQNADSKVGCLFGDFLKLGPYKVTYQLEVVVALGCDMIIDLSKYVKSLNNSSEID